MSSARGFVFTLEALIALMLFAGFLYFLASTPASSNHTEVKNLKTELTSALDYLNTKGAAQEILDTNLSTTDKMDALAATLASTLPAQVQYHAELSEYDGNAEACKLNPTFENCFSNGLTYPARGATIPTDRAVTHSRLFFVSRGSNQECSIGAAFSPILQMPKQSKLSFSEATTQKAFFDSATDLNIIFGVNVTPSGSASCDQNIRVDYNMFIDNNSLLYGRTPADIMVVLDKSGSMSWDGLLDLTDPRDVAVVGDYAYVADGSAGLRDINVLDQRNPAIVGTYNSPGTASGVTIAGNYAYLADGSSGLRIVNITNKASPASTGSIATIGTANTVSVDSTYAYVTTSATGSEILDTTVSGTPTTDTLIGKDASNTSAAQSFVATGPNISSVDVYMKKTGSPSGNLTVAIRSSINGSNLASDTISRNNIGSSYGWETATFASPLSVTSGQTYYIVLTTTQTSSTKYYQWGSVTTNPYASGTAYQNTTALSTTDSFFRTYHVIPAGLQIIDITTPATPTYVGTYATTTAQDAIVSGNYVYLADGSNGFKVIDVTTKSAPTLAGSVATTNAQSVALTGNYALVADGSAGIRSINVSNPATPSIAFTYNTPGTATDVSVYSDNNVYVADTSSVLALSISNPASLSLTNTFPTPYTYTTLAVSGGWAFVLPGYNTSLTTFSISTGPKMQQMQTAADGFIDFNGWKEQYDQLGLVSFSSSATLDSTLVKATDTNKTTLKQKINALVSNGGTAIDLALTSATNELKSSRRTPNSSRFEILLTDGQNNNGSGPVLTAAQTAADNNITLYTIGFGPDIDEATLEQAAALTGGQYYSASDQNALQDVFNFIAIDIGESLTGTGPVIAYDANLMVPVTDCSEIIDTNAGVCITKNDQNYIQYAYGTLYRNTTISNYLILNIPCDSSLACQTNSLTFMPQGTYFEWKDQNDIPQNPIGWDVNTTIDFQYRDLTLAVTRAEIVGKNKIQLDFNAQNVGKLATPATSIATYLDSPYTGQLLRTDAVGALNAHSFSLLLDRTVLESGNMFAIINPDNTIAECPGNNIVSLTCITGTGTKYYLLEVWMWVS